MQLHEMEEQIKILDERTREIDQILRALATKEDLDLAVKALQFEMAGLATKNDIAAIRRDMSRLANTVDIAALGEQIEALARRRR